MKCPIVVKRPIELVCKKGDWLYWRRDVFRLSPLLPGRSRLQELRKLACLVGACTLRESFPVFDGLAGVTITNIDLVVTALVRDVIDVMVLHLRRRSAAHSSGDIATFELSGITDSIT